MYWHGIAEVFSINEEEAWFASYSFSGKLAVIAVKQLLTGKKLKDDNTQRRGMPWNM